MSPGYCFLKGNVILVCLVLLLLAGITTVSAHAPLGVASNDDIVNASMIKNPEKSFVLYTELFKGGEAQYYQFPMKKGQILYGSFQVPGPDSMVPDIVIIGPGIEPAGNVPSFVEVPAGSGAMVIPGKSPGKPSYEPFSPQPIYEAGRFNVTVPVDGDYYIAVYGSTGGKYSLAPGFLEEFTAAEWLLIPFSLISIHLWEGQSLWAVLAPMIVVVTGGLALALMYRKKSGLDRDPLSWVILLSGLLYLGGAAMTALQIIHAIQVTGYTNAVIVTLMFIAGPIILGIFAIMEGTRQPRTEAWLKSGIKMVVIGILGLLLWAGLIIGPVLALISGVLILAKQARRPGHS